MSDRFVVAFDVGTSGVKAVLADLGGHPVASRYEPYGLRALDGGRVEQDVEEIYGRLGAACRPCWSAPASAPGRSRRSVSPPRCSTSSRWGPAASR
jgi:sugar (pentulose or hexulose) kinase